jgi:hypothetical protein
VTILEDICFKIENGRTEGECRDDKGNAVGQWTLRPRLAALSKVLKGDQ